MPWRHDVIEYVKRGDVENTLRLFDELWADRESARQVNTAYLTEICALKGGGAVPVVKVGPPTVSGGGEGCIEGLVAAQEAFRDALRKWSV